MTKGVRVDGGRFGPVEVLSPLDGAWTRNDNPMAGAMGCTVFRRFAAAPERVAWRDVFVWAMPVENLRYEEAAARI